MGIVFQIYQLRKLNVMNTNLLFSSEPEGLLENEKERIEA